MACSECENMRREYLLFRKAVTRFGALLDQLEVERLRIVSERRPDSIAPLMGIEPLDLNDAVAGDHHRAA